MQKNMVVISSMVMAICLVIITGIIVKVLLFPSSDPNKPAVKHEEVEKNLDEAGETIQIEEPKEEEPEERQDINSESSTIFSLHPEEFITSLNLYANTSHPRLKPYGNGENVHESGDGGWQYYSSDYSTTAFYINESENITKIKMKIFMQDWDASRVDEAVNVADAILQSVYGDGTSYITQLSPADKDGYLQIGNTEYTIVSDMNAQDTTLTITFN